jgi:hypothetical protein
MAQAITVPLYGHFIHGPGMVIALADQTTTTASQQFVGSGGKLISANWLEVMIYMKTFVVGTGTVYPMFTLEVADNTGFTTNRRRIAQVQPVLAEAIAAIPGSLPPMSLSMRGGCPDGAKNFVRLFCTTNGTSSMTYDVVFAGA